MLTTQVTWSWWASRGRCAKPALSRALLWSLGNQGTCGPSGDIFGCHAVGGGVLLDLVGRGQGWCSASYATGTTLQPRVLQPGTSCQEEKPHPRLAGTCRSQGVCTSSLREITQRLESRSMTGPRRFPGEDSGLSGNIKTCLPF